MNVVIVPTVATAPTEATATNVVTAPNVATVPNAVTAMTVASATEIMTGVGRDHLPPGAHDETAIPMPTPPVEITEIANVRTDTLQDVSVEETASGTVIVGLPDGTHAATTTDPLDGMPLTTVAEAAEIVVKSQLEDTTTIVAALHPHRSHESLHPT